MCNGVSKLGLLNNQENIYKTVMLKIVWQREKKKWLLFRFECVLSNPEATQRKNIFIFLVYHSNSSYLSSLLISVKQNIIADVKAFQVAPFTFSISFFLLYLHLYLIAIVVDKVIWSISAHKYSVGSTQTGVSQRIAKKQ